MRIIPFILCSVLTIGLVVVMNTKIGSLPAFGSLLSPSHGFWKNAEPSDASFSINIVSPELQNEVNVYLDERLVPHVFAQNNHDVHFVQGYLHAKFRLWQMEFQTFAAGGRLCEVLGEKTASGVSILERSDRKFRRMGMVMAAEKARDAMKENPVTAEACEAYTAGVNAYIGQLKPEDYPLEYKLLDYAPEKWTTLKTALFLKYMSYDLATDDDDFEFTNLLQKAGIATFEKMFPVQADSLDPISPKGTVYAASVAKPAAPASVDSLYLTSLDTTGIAYTLPHRDPDNGSNNWIVDSSKTATGRPILCNDPHLGLKLPSVWFEIQLATPEYSCYGVSFPGTPGVIIGFNDSIAWGVTNAMRDVMDFYEVQFKDSTMNEYMYNGQWKETKWRTETIHIRGKADFAEKIPVTIWGPVMYDGSFENELKNGKAYAIRWKAHEKSNELNSFLMLDKAKNYTDYLNAIKDFSCPGQNFVFASKSNQIAWWQQASFPAKWRRQGDFAMPGVDTAYEWQYDIPQPDNIHMLNPERGFISTANQLPADTTYPFYIGGLHDVYRGFIINRMLRNMHNITVDSMKKMQTDNYNVFAEMARPVFLKNIDSAALTPMAAKMLADFASWNLRADVGENGQAIFSQWWRNFEDTVWLDDITRPDGLATAMPYDQTLLEGILKDSAYIFVDNTLTTAVETLPTMITAALNKTAEKLGTFSDISWGTQKDTHIDHLLLLMPFSRQHLSVGGGEKIINATKKTHGPSWRVVVSLTDKTEAWGVYPGGQTGNPGSQYYDQFVNTWAAGEYYNLWMMKHEEATSTQVKWTMKFSKG